MARLSGEYWVKTKAGRWMIARWKDKYKSWWAKGHDAKLDSHWSEIEEKLINT